MMTPVQDVHEGCEYVDELDRTVGPVKRLAADEIIARLAPELQQALHEPQTAWSQRVDRLPEP
jgi:hypothetical protein